MSILPRLFVIAAKAVKVLALLTLIRCFGSPGAACLLANAAAVWQRVLHFLRSLF